MYTKQALRELGFNDPFAEYGIHGTTEPDTVGQAISQGCVRMRNPDVEELFDLVPLETAVEIRD